MDPWTCGCGGRGAVCLWPGRWQWPSSWPVPSATWCVACGRGLGQQGGPVLGGEASSIHTLAPGGLSTNLLCSHTPVAPFSPERTPNSSTWCPVRPGLGRLCHSLLPFIPSHAWFSDPGFQSTHCVPGSAIGLGNTQQNRQKPLSFGEPVFLVRKINKK